MPVGSVTRFHVYACAGRFQKLLTMRTSCGPVLLSDGTEPHAVRSNSIAPPVTKSRTMINSPQSNEPKETIVRDFCDQSQYCDASANLILTCVWANCRNIQVS